MKIYTLTEKDWMTIEASVKSGVIELLEEAEEVVFDEKGNLIKATKNAQDVVTAVGSTLNAIKGILEDNFQDGEISSKDIEGVIKEIIKEAEEGK